MKRKRILSFLLLSATVLMLCASMLSAAGITASAASTARQNWFFKPNGNQKPQLLGGSTLPAKYGALALDSSDEKVIYLTFDAGYENGNVASILDTLNKHNAIGAFFILPGLIKHSPDIVQRMTDEGHTVCNHSTTHKDMSAITSADAFRKELSGLEEAYTALTGKQLAPYFRPPEGSFSEQTLIFCNQFGYRAVFWSYAYADWDNNAQPDLQKAKQKLLSNLHPGEVLLLHPTSATNAAILDDLLTEMEAQGYRFGTLDELAEKTPIPSATESTLSIEEYQQQGLVFSHNRAAGNVLALTFDDGPHATQTDEILQVLAKYDVTATFFPIGKNISEHTDIIKRVADAGHEIGNHTYSHATVSKLTNQRLREEILSTADLLQQIGITPIVFRPPGGDISEQAIKLVNQLGYRYVLWSWRVDTRDWAAVSVDRVVNTVLNNVQGGDVILFHDYVVGKSPTARALDILIPKLQAQGYRFVTVSELANL